MPHGKLDMADPLSMDDSLSDGPLPIDRPSPIKGHTFRELVQELDNLGSDDAAYRAAFNADERGVLSSWEIGFVADAIDNPERFRTPKQLATIVKVWERHCG